MSRKDFWTAVLLSGSMIAIGMMIAHLSGCGGDQPGAMDRGAASVSDTGASE